MSNLSERVQREFDNWKEKYNIPYYMEFHVKTLLKLQEEYDSVEEGSNTTRTRETLLNMINKLQISFPINNLKEKVIVKQSGNEIILIKSITNLKHELDKKYNIDLRISNCGDSFVFNEKTAIIPNTKIIVKDIFELKNKLESEISSRAIKYTKWVMDYMIDHEKNIIVRYNCAL